MTKLLSALLILLLNLNIGFAHEQSKITSLSLAPHITELIYSAGGGDSLLGVSAYSNYPPEVDQKPIIGDAFHLNLELISQLNPDLIFYWLDGTPKQTIEQLKSMDFNLVAIEITQLADIPKAVHQIANSLHTKPVKATDEFQLDLSYLKNQPHESLTALIQVSDQPIFTVNGTHWMSEVINICGLNNVFTDLPVASAAVNLEAVILKKPDVIIRTTPFSDGDQLLAWTSIPAIKNNHVAVLEADHFTRPTLRTLLAIESLCHQIKQF